MIPIFHLVPLDSLEIKVSACRAGQWEVAIQLIDHFYRAGHEAEAWKFFFGLCGGLPFESLPPCKCMARVVHHAF